jgi:hypothetical protein
MSVQPTNKVHFWVVPVTLLAINALPLAVTIKPAGNLSRPHDAAWHGMDPLTGSGNGVPIKDGLFFPTVHPNNGSPVFLAQPLLYPSKTDPKELA